MKKRGLLLESLLIIIFLLISFVSAGELKVTEEHPFLVNGKWISASQLQVGDVLQTVDGKKVRITSLKDMVSNSNFPVYNLEAGVYHNFAIGLDRVIVHNSDNLGYGLYPSLQDTDFFKNYIRDNEVLSSYFIDPQGFDRLVEDPKAYREYFYQVANFLRARGESIYIRYTPDATHMPYQIVILESNTLLGQYSTKLSRLSITTRLVYDPRIPLSSGAYSSSEAALYLPFDYIQASYSAQNKRLTYSLLTHEYTHLYNQKKLPADSFLKSRFRFSNGEVPNAYVQIGATTVEELEAYSYGLTRELSFLTGPYERDPILFSYYLNQIISSTKTNSPSIMIAKAFNSHSSRGLSHLDLAINNLDSVSFKLSDWEGLPTIDLKSQKLYDNYADLFFRVNEDGLHLFIQSSSPYSNMNLILGKVSNNDLVILADMISSSPSLTRKQHLQFVTEKLIQAKDKLRKINALSKYMLDTIPNMHEDYITLAKSSCSEGKCYLTKKGAFELRNKVAKFQRDVSQLTQ